MTASIVILILIIILIPSLLNEIERNKQIVKRREKLYAKMNENSILAEEFYLKRNTLQNKGFNTHGIYIFTNATNDKKYVGQSINVLDRINTHLKGRGNPDIYNHILNGDVFIIDFIKLQDTTFRNLDELEKFFITKYNTYHNGYNRTRGNGNT